MRATPTVAASIPNTAPIKMNKGAVSSLLSSQMPANSGSKREKSMVQDKFQAMLNAVPFFTADDSLYNSCCLGGTCTNEPDAQVTRARL